MKHITLLEKCAGPINCVQGTFSDLIIGGELYKPGTFTRQKWVSDRRPIGGYGHRSLQMRGGGVLNMIQPWNMTDRELVLEGLSGGDLARELALRFEAAIDLAELLNQESLQDEIEAMESENGEFKDEISRLESVLSRLDSEVLYLELKLRELGEK